MKGNQEVLYLGTWVVATKGVLYLDLDGRCLRGFFTSEPELWRSRGFFTLILIEGN